MGNSWYPTCIKTAKGTEEVERKVHGLSFKSRQVLIMIDGKRNLAALQEMFPSAAVLGILEELTSGGFIQQLETPKPAPPPSAPAVSAAAATPSSEESFTMAKSFMMNSARDILGVAANGFVAKVKTASDAEALRELLPDWRHAITQTPDGPVRIASLEKKLLKVLESA